MPAHPYLARVPQRCRERPRPCLSHNAWMETLDEWAKRHGRNIRAVRNQLLPQPTFPAPKGQRAPVGRGKPAREYDSDELDTWLSEWEAARRPETVTVPDGTDLDEFRTLGTIAALAGHNSKNFTQYRPRIDTAAQHYDRGARRFYRTGDVLDVLNERLGRGRSLDPEDGRRARGKISDDHGIDDDHNDDD